MTGGGEVKVVLATRNAHKRAEIRDALALDGVVFESLEQHPDLPDVVEDGDTFEANARKKAREVCRATGWPALADDSGLVVEALGGAPGVRSARFAGPDADDTANRARLRERLAGVPEDRRGAKFVCVLSLALPSGEDMIVTGECRGTLLDQERGEGGFGYDPLFVPEGHAKTFAEISRREKASLSHRGRALAVARGPAGRFVREWAARR